MIRTYKLDDINLAFSDSASGETVKPVVVYKAGAAGSGYRNRPAAIGFEMPGGHEMEVLDVRSSKTAWRARLVFRADCRWPGGRPGCARRGCGVGEHAGSGAGAAAKAADLPCTATAVRVVVKLPHVSVGSVVDETSGSFTPPGTTIPITGLPVFCQVSLVQTDSAGNPVNIVVWLPAKWNGNFQGVGGAGYTCGPYYTAPGIAGSLAEGVEGGYATASTDCGVPISEGATGSWALKPDGTLNWPLIQDFASDGMHDMSVASKASPRPSTRTPRPIPISTAALPAAVRA